MNRHERRRQARMSRENRFVRDYVRHLPEADLSTATEPGSIIHMVCRHDDWCSIYDNGGGLAACNCGGIMHFTNQRLDVAFASASRERQHDGERRRAAAQVLG